MRGLRKRWPVLDERAGEIWKRNKRRNLVQQFDFSSPTCHDCRDLPLALACRASGLGPGSLPVSVRKCVNCLWSKSARCVKSATDMTRLTLTIILAFLCLPVRNSRAAVDDHDRLYALPPHPRDQVLQFGQRVCHFPSTHHRMGLIPRRHAR